jgi:hypothetical protein
MKKTVFLWLILIVLGTAGVKAQVAIGSRSIDPLTPHPGAILDLQSTAEEPKGLLLPWVEMSDINTFGWSGNQDDAAGMIIYQKGDQVTKGIYLWIKETGQPGKWELIVSVE